MADVRLIDYNGKKYDRDALIKAAIDSESIKKYLSQYNVSASKAQKFEQAVREFGQQLSTDLNSSATLTGINFSDDYANQAGSFGKNRKDSKYYKNAAYYFLQTLDKSSPYEEPKPEEKPKIKLNPKVLGEKIIELRGDTSALSDQDKLKADSDILNKMLGLYDWENPDKYELDEGYDLSTLKGLLTNASTAITNTPDNLDDDNYPYYQLGIKGPLYRAKENNQYNNIYNQLKNTGVFSEDELKTYEPFIKKFMQHNVLSGIFGEEALSNLPLIKSSATVASENNQSPKTQKHNTNNNVSFSFNTVLPIINGVINNKHIYKSAKEEEKAWLDGLNKYDTDMTNLMNGLHTKTLTSGTVIPKNVSPDQHGFYKLGSGKYYTYGYDSRTNQMQLVENIQKPKSKTVIYRKMGGYLQTLRNNYAYSSKK